MICCFFFFKQKTAYEMRISDWSSDVCSSDLLALGLAREISERHGVAVDVSIHAPGREGDQRNHHAHLLTTTRRLGPEGLGEKTRELDQKQSGEVERWRERWAEMQNRAPELANVPDRVDHRSHQRQGIEQEPTVHMGPSATAMERRAEQVAAREGRAYEPGTAVGQHHAGVVDRAERKRGVMGKGVAGPGKGGG